MAHATQHDRTTLRRSTTSLKSRILSRFSRYGHSFNPVASLSPQKGDSILWTSGNVTSSTQIGVRYAGPAMPSASRLWWQVQVWAVSSNSTSIASTCASRPRCVLLWSPMLLSEKDHCAYDVWCLFAIACAEDMQPTEARSQRPLPLRRGAAHQAGLGRRRVGGIAGHAPTDHVSDV